MATTAEEIAAIQQENIRNVIHMLDWRATERYGISGYQGIGCGYVVTVARSAWPGSTIYDGAAFVDKPGVLIRLSRAFACEVFEAANRLTKGDEP